jgi:phospholipase C
MTDASELGARILRAGGGARVAVASVAIVLLLVSASFEVSANGKVVTQTPIKHVVIIMQENHSFFNYWAAYPGVVGGLAGATCQKYANGTKLCPYVTVNPSSTGDLNHSGSKADIAYANGTMNGFLKANPNDKVMGYYNGTVLGYYWGLAEHYTLNDMFFSSYLSYSLPNHWAAIAGNSPAVAITKMGKYLYTNATTTDLVEEASEIETMLEAAQAYKPVSVRYYDEPVGYKNLTQAISLGGDTFVDNYWNPNLEKADTYTTLRSDFVNRTSIFTAISSGHLPSISWVIPNENISEHPPANVEFGEQWVQMIDDAVMNSKYWDSTAIFVMTDDWGAFYDPIAPGTLPNISPNMTGTSGGQIELGFRVSSLLISPYANRGIVSTTFSFESVLHFIDYNWGMPLLNQRVAAANNMLSDFNFNQKRLSPWLGPPLTPAQTSNVMSLAGLDTPDTD